MTTVRTTSRTTWSNFTNTRLFTPYGDRDVTGYADENVSAVRGRLRFELNDYGAGGILGPVDGFTFAEVAIRFRASRTLTGTGGVFLLWPTGNVWAEGEVNIAEGDYDRPIEGFVHRMVEGHEAEHQQVTTGSSWCDWHTARVRWEPGRLRFYLDDRLTLDTTTDVPSTPHRLVFQTKPRPGSTPGHVEVASVTLQTTTSLPQ